MPRLIPSLLRRPRFWLIACLLTGGVGAWLLNPEWPIGAANPGDTLIVVRRGEETGVINEAGRVVFPFGEFADLQVERFKSHGVIETRTGQDHNDDYFWEIRDADLEVIARVNNVRFGLDGT